MRLFFSKNAVPPGWCDTSHYPGGTAFWLPIPVNSALLRAILSNHHNFLANLNNHHDDAVLRRGLRTNLHKKGVGNCTITFGGSENVSTITGWIAMQLCVDVDIAYMNPDGFADHLTAQMAFSWSNKNSLDAAMDVEWNLQRNYWGLLKKHFVRSIITFTFFPLNSTDFFHYSKWMFVPNMKKFPQGIPKISHSQETGRTTWKPNASSYRWCGGMTIKMCLQTKADKDGQCSSDGHNWETLCSEKPGGKVWSPCWHQSLHWHMEQTVASSCFLCSWTDRFCCPADELLRLPHFST